MGLSMEIFTPGEPAENNEKKQTAGGVVGDVKTNPFVPKHSPLTALAHSPNQKKMDGSIMKIDKSEDRNNEIMMGVRQSEDVAILDRADALRAIQLAGNNQPVENSKDALWRARRKILPISSESLFKRQVDGAINYYFKETDKSPLFIDYGSKMQLTKVESSDLEIIAMLDAADKKYGKFEVFGSDEFKQRAAVLAGKYGFNITNPELADVVKLASGNEQAQHQPMSV